MFDNEPALARTSTAQACQGDSSMPLGQFTNSEVMEQLRQVCAEFKACSAKLDRIVDLIDQRARIPAEDGDESATQASQASEHPAGLAWNEGFANPPPQIEKFMAECKEFVQGITDSWEKTKNSLRKRVHVSDELEKDAEYELSNKRQKPNDEDINNQAGPSERRQPGAAQIAEASCSAASDDKKSSPQKSPTKRPTVAVEYTSLAELEEITKYSKFMNYEKVVGKIKMIVGWNPNSYGPFKLFIECSGETIEVIFFQPQGKYYYNMWHTIKEGRDIRIESARTVIYHEKLQLHIKEDTRIFIIDETGTEIPIPTYKDSSNTIEI